MSSFKTDSDMGDVDVMRVHLLHRNVESADSPHLYKLLLALCLLPNQVAQFIKVLLFICLK